MRSTEYRLCQTNTGIILKSKVMLLNEDGGIAILTSRKPKLARISE